MEINSLNNVVNIELRLNSGEHEAWELKGLIAEQNIKGIRLEMVEKPSGPGTLSGTDYLPILNLVLASTATAAAIKGLFNITKYYFELQKKQIDSKSKEIDRDLIEFIIKKKDGTKVSVKFHAFDQAERQRFFDAVDTFLQNK